LFFSRILFSFIPFFRQTMEKNHIDRMIEGHDRRKRALTSKAVYEWIEALELAANEKDRLEQTNIKLVKDNERLVAYSKILEKINATLLAEIVQFKQNQWDANACFSEDTMNLGHGLHEISVKIEKDEPPIREFRDLKEECVTSIEAANSLPSDTFSRASITSLQQKSLKDVDDKLQLDEPGMNNLKDEKCSLNLGKERRQSAFFFMDSIRVKRKFKRRLSGDWSMSSRKRRKEDFTCSKCGNFKGTSFRRNKRAKRAQVSHKCGSPAKFVSFTIGKIHNRLACLVLRGNFNESEMKMKVRALAKISKVKTECA